MCAFLGHPRTVSDVLTIQEAADATGFSPKTLYAAARDGRLFVEPTSIGFLVPLVEVQRVKGLRTLGSRKAAQALRRIEAKRAA